METYPSHQGPLLGFSRGPGQSRPLLLAASIFLHKPVTGRLCSQAFNVSVIKCPSAPSILSVCFVLFISEVIITNLFISEEIITNLV